MYVHVCVSVRAVNTQRSRNSSCLSVVQFVPQQTFLKPGAKESIFASSACAHVYITMYICLAGCHEVYMPSADVVTLAQWEQMEEQWGVWNEKLYKSFSTTVHCLWISLIHSDRQYTTDCM